MIGRLISTLALMTLSSVPHAESFTTRPMIKQSPWSAVSSRNKTPLSRLNPNIIYSTFCSTSNLSLEMANSDDEEPYDRGYVDGSTTGAILMAVVLLINVWIFSIPVEFRRARICNEEDVALYPKKNCITASEWTTGISKYYSNGGGIKFDFSIEGK